MINWSKSDAILKIRIMISYQVFFLIKNKPTKKRYILLCTQVNVPH